MKKMSLIVLLLFIFNPLQAIDFPKLKGWKSESEITIYNPENLYEYINGAADQFLDYGFQRLTSQDLSKGDLVVTVDIYDMGSALNAFGMYKVESAHLDKKLKIGVEAVVVPPYQCLLLKDQYYVKVNTLEGEIEKKTGELLLKAIAEGLSGSNQLPTVLENLPVLKKVPNSEGFSLTSFIGFKELRNCVFAKYRNQEKEYFQFILLPSEDRTSESIWDEIEQKWNKLEHENLIVLYKKVPYQGFAGIVKKDGLILGVTNCEVESELIEKLK